MCLGSSSPTNWGREATDVDSLFVAGGEGWMEKERENGGERGKPALVWGGGRNTDSIAVLMPCSDDAVSPTGPDCRKFPLRPDSPAPSVRPPLFAAVARAADGGGG